MGLIDKQAAMDCCFKPKVIPGGAVFDALKMAIRNEIEALPEVLLSPVVHGEWIMTKGMKPPEYHHHHQCSVCESYAPMRPPYGGREELSPWCPACGAKMDLEVQDGSD